jgi:hypothetical protein
MWIPTETLLGTHAELAFFSHTVQYYVEGAAGDPLAVPPVEAGAPTYYNVRIIAQETNPDTVTFSTGNPGTVGGYYKGIFNDSLMTRAEDGSFTTITTLGENAGVFDAVNRTNVYQVISFKADTTRSRTFTYVAQAFDPLFPNTVIASQTYTILAEDKNWTPGMMNLKELVSYASSK